MPHTTHLREFVAPRKPRPTHGRFAAHCSGTSAPSCSRLRQRLGVSVLWRPPDRLLARDVLVSSPRHIAFQVQRGPLVLRRAANPALSVRSGSQFQNRGPLPLGQRCGPGRLGAAQRRHGRASLASGAILCWPGSAHLVKRHRGSRSCLARSGGRCSRFGKRKLPGNCARGSALPRQNRESIQAPIGLVQPSNVKTQPVRHNMPVNRTRYGSRGLAAPGHRWSLSFRGQATSASAGRLPLR